MRNILILADDLSGAADCAHACMSSGLDAVVTFEDSDHDLTSDVLSVDCDTRHLPPEEAAARVTRIMRAYVEKGPAQLVFKKVDSTLRGNVGAEIRATLEERRRTADPQRRIVSVLAPAFPVGGRTTIGGYQLVHGVPLHQTEIWKHNGLPGVAYMPAMLQAAGLRTATLDLEAIRSGHAQLTVTMQQLASEADVLVCDTEMDEDLNAIARASFGLGRETIWAGSAGLAHQLPHAAHLTARSRAIFRPDFSDGPMLFVIGSMSSVSHQQAVLLERNAPVRSIHVSPRVLLQGPTTRLWAKISAKISSSLQGGNHTLVVLDPSERVDVLERRKLTDALGVMLSPFADRVGALVATGGETARAIFNGWKVPSLEILGEVERGLPYSIVEVNGRPIPVLTKAGAFGDANALRFCWQFLADLLSDRSYASLRKTL